jgi:hypothetical protein
LSLIFICYRRDDAQEAAFSIADRLRQEFGEESVFIDVVDIQPGERFQPKIEDTIRKSDVFICIISKLWLKAEDAGSRRLDQPHDPVRTEIRLALQHEIPVIPVLIGDVVMPPKDELPGDIQDLQSWNAIYISYRNNKFRRDCDVLVAAVKKRVGGGGRNRRVIASVFGASMILVVAATVPYFAVSPPAEPQSPVLQGAGHRPANPDPQSVTTRAPISRRQRDTTSSARTADATKPTKTDNPTSTDRQAPPQTKDCKAALPELQRVARLHPKDAEVNYELGACLIKEGQLVEGRRYVNEAYHAGKDPAAVYTEFARAAWKDGDGDNALHYIGKALDTTAGFAPAMLLQGEIYLQKGKPSLAYKILREVWKQKQTRQVCLAYHRAAVANNTDEGFPGCDNVLE